ncbi:MAG: hypothetical protein GX945_06085 [Lentisphaerae bacterium]|nr:hypothetical protein [Lentisphaerota bacterium]
MTNEAKIKSILDTLNEVNEELLALPDDMLLSIDPRDNESISTRSAFMQEYNVQLEDFSAGITRITTLLKNFFDVDPEQEDEESNIGEKQHRDRIVQELDRNESHSLDESFTFKRPYGFVLNDRAYKGLKTWKNLYLHVLNYLYESDPSRFVTVTQDKTWISRRDNPAFSANPSELRVAAPIPGDLYAEINLSANSMVKNIKKLLTSYGIPLTAMKVYLREDRDAAAKSDDSSN